MKPELLAKFADIINANSHDYRASIPNVRREYMVLDNGKLVKVFCYVLEVRLIGKVKCHKIRSAWNIYEFELDRIIDRISRRDKSFAERIDSCSPTPTDVEMLVRRASQQSLRLHLTSTAYDVYNR